MKTCSRCNTEKEESEFYDKGKKKQSMCKSCFNKYCMERWTARKIEAIRYLGTICAHCSKSYHHAAMQFHHIDPDTKDCDWTKLRLKSVDKIHSELDKCILLCANCHSILHSGN